MKQGKIILGAAAFIVTAASALAFKTANNFRTKHVLGPTVVGGTCFTTTCFATVNGKSTGVCHTLAGVKTVLTAGGANAGKLWTVKTATNGKCANLSKWTHVQ